MDYMYGSVATFDNIDPDFFSMLELAEMGNKVPLEREYYQHLWLRPGTKIFDGLRPLEGEADILSLLGEMRVEAAKFIRVFVKKLTFFQARKAMAEVYKELCTDGLLPAGGVILEELDVGGRDEGENAMNALPRPLAIEWVDVHLVCMWGPIVVLGLTIMIWHLTKMR
ncbi:hypothetical protein LINGRAHAP2_LOCUS7740 [Linum grandiflorum]